MILAMCLPPHAARPTARPAHVTLPSRSLGAQVVKHSRLLSSSSTAFLQQKLQLRAPYVAPLNILQAREVKGISPVPLFLSNMLQPIAWEISICKARSVPALCTIVSSLPPCSLYSAANPLPCCCRSAALKRCVRLRAAPVWRAWCPLTIRCAARIRRG